MSGSNGCFVLFGTRYNLLCVLSAHCTENGVGEDELRFENYPHTVMILHQMRTLWIQPRTSTRQGTMTIVTLI